MAGTLIKTSFAAGELNPSLGGRVDIAKYAVGAQVMRNFFVDYRGGASTRPGTALVGRCRSQSSSSPPKPRLIPFQYGAQQAAVLELVAGKMRIVYNSGYILESAVNITAASGNPVTITAPGATWVPGDTIYISGVAGFNRPNGTSILNGRTFHIDNAVGSVFTLGVESGTNNWYADYNAAAIGSVYTSGGTAARVYEVTTPWADVDLFDLVYTQSADVMTVTHLGNAYPIYDIKRYGAANWTITQEMFGASSAPPVPTASSVNNNGANPQYFFSYVVTTVDANNRESIASAQATVVNQALSQTATPNVINTLSWPAVAGAYKYKVYKAQPAPNGYQGSGPYFYGLIQNSFDETCNDVNYAPDYTQTPPQARNPFLDNGIASVIISAAGAEWASPYATISDPTGTGAVLAVYSDTSAAASPYGKISRVNVVSPGTGYTSPTITVLDAAPPGSGLQVSFNGSWIATPGGTGFVPAPGSISITNGGTSYHNPTIAGYIRATAATGAIGTNYLPVNIASAAYGAVTSITYPNSAILPTPLTGLSSVNTGGLIFTVVGSDASSGYGATLTATLGGTTNPGCVSFLDQRKVFAGSAANPSTLWLSQPGQFNNFNVNDPQQDNDAITASLYSQEVNQILSMTPVPAGLMVFTAGGAFLVSGGAPTAAVTPTTIQAPIQAFDGASSLRPLRIIDHVLYAQARGSAVRDLAYNVYTNNFTGTDVSVLSSHLLEGRTITQWCYAQEPLKIVWAVRDDGVLLSLTYLKEQDVFGWARHDTDGSVVSVATIPEGTEDAVYIVVKRWTPGEGFRYCTERMQSRLFGSNHGANIPANPELAFCVDNGVAAPLTYTSANIISGVLTQQGALYAVSIGAGGSGYSGPIAEIDDLTGTGAIVSFTVTAGVITGVTIVNGGTGYTSPAITVRDPTGSGAAVWPQIITTMLVTVDSYPGFTSLAIGSVLRVRGGMGYVISVPTPQQLLVDVRVLPSPLPNRAEFRLPLVGPTEWTLTAPVSVVSGLDHLNGETVQVVADGSVQLPRTVVDGCVTLDAPATAIIVGRGFTAQLQTMRFESPSGESIQQKRKALPTLMIRARDTRGLSVGSMWDELVEVKERADEYLGTPIQFEYGGERLPPLFAGAPVAPAPFWAVDKNVNIETTWDQEGVICVQQSYPMPATVLLLAPDVWVGDDD